MGPRLRRTVLVLGALMAIAVGGAARAGSAEAFTFRVSVTGTTLTSPLAGNFLGLAFEYGSIPGLVGSPTSQTVDPVLVQLIKNLDPAGRPLIRVGGISTDRTWWPIPGMAKPLGITANLTPAWMAAAQALAQATNAQYVLGVNLEANRPQIAAVEAQQLLQGIGSQYVDGLEIGNEPDLYTSIPWYKKLAGRIVPWYSKTGTPVYSRRPTYGPTQYVQEFERTLKALPAGVPVAGPETGNWLSPFSSLLTPTSPVRMLTSHEYGLNQCVTDPASPVYPSVPHLLSLTASRGQIGNITPFVALAHRDGASYRIDEMGSISCNGRAGVSNTEASALWALDALFQDAADGVDGVNLHTYPNSANGLFDFTLVNGQWQATVHPLYYGALMFEQAAPAGSRLLRISTGNQSNYRAWATRGADGRTRVLLIDDSTTSSAVAVVKVAGAGGSAAIERLGAPSAYATAGLSLGGQTFGAETTDGVLPPPAPQAVAARSGSYTVTLTPASAALLTLPAATAASRRR